MIRRNSAMERASRDSSASSTSAINASSLPNVPSTGPAAGGSVPPPIPPPPLDIFQDGHRNSIAQSSAPPVGHRQW